MTEPKPHLVHTEPGAPDGSTTSAAEMVQFNRGASSSAEERPVHTGEVVGSNPSSRTVTDPIADLLADPERRMRVEERFWPKVMKPMGWDGCWPWTASKHPRGGYGRFKIASYTNVRAPRLSYALYYGVSPGALFVCHHCDNPECVNPLHLFLGTVQDNSDDMMRKGRWKPHDQAGERNGAAKLSAAQVGEIRDLIRNGLTNTAIALRFGVTHQLISRIRRGRAWGDTPMQPAYASLRR